MELIPGLPNDVARECLTRVPYNSFITASSICKNWKAEINHPEFRWLRFSNGHTQKLIVMAQSHVTDNTHNSNDGGKRLVVPTYRITVCEPGSGQWTELPSFHEFRDGLPIFCQLVSVGSGLVLIGGLDPNTWTALRSVYVYDFLLAKWRRGADMPGGARSFFGCASDLDRMVYVAGGHDDEKNALRSALAYDVAKDEWRELPDMARERDECNCVFLRGKFHVIGGYCTEMQGRFEKSVDVFDVDTWKWSPIQHEYLDACVSPMTCVSDADGAMYMCRDGDVVMFRGNTWQSVAKLPAEVCNATYTLMWQGNLLVIGCARHGDPFTGYVLNVKDCTWTKLECKREYSGHVQSGCFVEI